MRRSINSTSTLCPTPPRNIPLKVTCLARRSINTRKTREISSVTPRDRFNNVLANTWPEFANNTPFKSPLPWSITCSGVPEKSRVETQIRLRLGITHESGQNAWPLLKLDPKAISPTHVTKKISKDKKEEQQSLAERERSEEHVIMETRIVSAGTNVAEALTRASSATEVNHVLDAHSLWACYGCIQRERKNVQRKMKGQTHVDPNAIDRHSILQFYCDQYFDLNQLRGEFVTPLRVTCYCRHHKELEGFSILVLLFNSTTRALIGTCQTQAVMITDDHKSSALNQGTVPSTPHVTSKHQCPGRGLQQHFSALARLEFRRARFSAQIGNDAALTRTSATGLPLKLFRRNSTD
jgi:hypothetical protein